MLERFRNWLRTPSQTPSKPPDPTTLPGWVELVNVQLGKLQEIAVRVEAIEARESQMQLAWQETLDKLGRWASKQAARERRRVDRDLDILADGPSNGGETHEDPPGSTNGGGVDIPGGGDPRAAVKAQLRARAATLFRR